MKLLELVKYMKIKHSVSSSQKYGRTFLFKKLFMGQQTLLGKFIGRFFYIGSSDQIMQGGKKSFTNTSSSNLNSVNLKISPAMVEDTLENKS